MKNFIKKITALTLVLVFALSICVTNAFAASVLDATKAQVANITDKVKSGAGTKQDVDSLLGLVKKGNIDAVNALFSFDCFNPEELSKAHDNMALAPNTSRTYTFDDGSYVVDVNTTIPDKAPISSLLSIVPYSFPTTPRTSYIYEYYYIAGVEVGHHGGSAYWQNLNRNSCHLISVSPYIGGIGMTITNESATILQNNIVTSTFSVYANITIVQAGIVVFTRAASDIIYIDTTGVTGFRSNGLGM